MDTRELKRVPLFSSLPDDEASALVQAFRFVEYPTGTMIFREGDPGGTFCINLDGEIEIVKALGTPEELQLAVLGAGAYLGEMSLLNPDGRRTAGARTRTPVSVMELSRIEFEVLLDRHPRLAFELVREISARLRGGQDAAIRDLQIKNRELALAYDDLKAAQDQIIEQEKLAHELDIAQRIQAGLLPRQLPSVPGRKMSAHWQPARYVGGDFYDFIVHSDGRLGIVIADVSGKGIPAALMMAITRSLFRPAAERLVSPGAVLAEVNELLIPDMPANMFVTCLYVLLDPADHSLEIANAGHCLPFLCSPDEIVELRTRGMPLGLMPGMQYEETRARLAPEAALLMYSDGLVEAHSPDREMFGSKRLRAGLAKHESEGRRIRGLIPTLLESMAAFTGPISEQEDDVTLLSLEPENP